MDPESKKLLEATLTLAQENNKMLHTMRRSMRMARIMSFFYWAFIIGSAVGAYYFIQPFINPLLNMYTGANGILNNLDKLGH